MKKLSIPVLLLSSVIFPTATAVAEKIPQELCWQSTQNSCLLKLRATQNNNYYSFYGNEICQGTISNGIHGWMAGYDAINVHSFVSGSGYNIANNDQIKIGLNIASSAIINTPPDFDNYKVHLDSVFIGEISISDLSITKENEGPSGGSQTLAYTNISCNPKK